MYSLFFKKKGNKKHLIEKIVGDNIEFTVDHQVLNATIFATGLANILCILQNIIADMHKILVITNTISLFCFGMLFVIARVYKIYKNISIFYLTIFFITFSIDWFPNGGIQGALPYFYLTLLGYIIYLTKGIRQIVFLSIFVLNIAVLFYLEYNYPELSVSYPDRKALFLDMFFSFILLLFFIAFLVYLLKKLYQQEKKNTIDVINQYRKNSANLKERYSEIISLLSLREREVFEKIIEGKSNKEIASQLYIDEGTVKNHITNVYKKLEVNKRIELIDKIKRITS